MPLARLRRALTSSSTNSSDSTTSSTTTSSNTSTLEFSLNTSTSPRDISYFELPPLSHSPTTRNPTPRDVFPSSPKEAGFTNLTFQSPSATATVRPISPSSPSSTAFKKQEIKHKRTSSRTSALMRILRRERPHPAERLLKPADPVVVCVLDQWGGFGANRNGNGRRSEEWEGVGPMDDF